jgi:hypothetical protein
MASATQWSDLFCIGWGNLRHEECEHKDCPVVLTKETVNESAIAPSILALGRRFPLVCPCECRVCRRAWWAAGRPILKNGKIVTTLI